MASTSRGSGSGKGKAKAKSNTSLVDQFCSITGADVVVALQMLEACNNNLEMAINMHVDGECVTDMPGPSGLGTDLQGTSLQGTTLPESDENVRAPFPPVRAVLVEDGFGFGPRPRKRAGHSVFDGFRDFQAEAQIQEQGLGSLSPSAFKKRKTLEDLFRPPLDLIHHGSFESARDMGQSRNKWMMVNIQNGQEFSCQVLNRDVWSSPAVKNIIKEQFVFWQVYHDSEEGQRYVQFYKVTDYPYVAVLDPLTGEKMVSWNKIEATSFCDILSEFLSEQQSPDGSLTNHIKFAKEAESIVDKTEEQQLQAAIEASLEGGESQDTHQNEDMNVSSLSSKSSEDGSIDLETFDSDNEGNPGENGVANRSKEMENHVEEIDMTGEWTDHLGPETDPMSQLVLRFPDGERKQFSLACTSKLQALLMYIVSQGFSQEDFEVVTTFPRRQLSALPRHKTLKELGLYPREMIYVQTRST